MKKISIMLGGGVVLLVLALLQFAPLATPTQAESVKGKGQSTQALEGPGGKHKVLDPAGIQRLKIDTGNKAKVTVSDATGSARFVRFAPGTKGDLMGSTKAGTANVRSAAFFKQYGGIFGIKNDQAELKLTEEKADKAAGKNLTYRQYYQGVPVFAGILKTHFDASGNLSAVNGNFIPEIKVNSKPSKSAQEAAATALDIITDEMGADRGLSVAATTLYVYRTGLAKGVNGLNYLVWEVEVSNRTDARDMLYIDAHTGQLVDRLPGIVDGMYRRAYNGQGLTQAQILATIYPNSPFWVEGDAFPTGNAEADNMIVSSKETYDYYNNAFGRDSFDGTGGIMDSIFNRGYSCPNASWNGTFISFCPGMTTDDVTAHEWSHAYTQYTHGLIYQWQPGALNESYSDIHGETVDRINGRDNVGNSANDPARTDDSCSTYGGIPRPALVVTGGAAAGSYLARASVNEPARPFTVGPLPMALSVPNGACSAITSNVAGKIVVIDWTLLPNGANQCGSGARAQNAINAGAAGIIFIAPSTGFLNLGSLAGIASLEISAANGATIKANLPANATISLGVGTDASTRWLVGEDDTAVGLTGALRDMMNPSCFANPGKVTDASFYVCGPGTAANDNGGVHTNSGIPNHAYALIVDGGTYNGYTINGIGLTKAAHIYFRAESVYQNPASDFADHADAIEQSATDLIGVDLADLVTGQPSGQIITASDVNEVKKAMLATEMRTQPVQCGFTDLLGKNPPADPACNTGLSRVTFYNEDFEGNTAAWTASGTPGATNSGGFGNLPNWSVSSTLPDRAGKAFFVPNTSAGNVACASPTLGEAGVRSVTSPSITIPATSGNTILRYKNWMASEFGFDGGQLYISVNGGPFTLVTATPTQYFLYNGYNIFMATTAQGSDNPRQGQQALSGGDGGKVDGSWGTTVVNLTALAPAGSNVQLRWDFSNDSCGGSTFGWYIDDVSLTSCVAPVATNTVVDPAAGQYSDQVTLKATVSPMAYYDQTGAGSVAFTVNGNSVGSAPINAAGIATLPYTIGEGAGSYTIGASFSSSNAAFQNSGGSNTLTVSKENATVTPDAANPFAVKVASAGGTSPAFTLKASIKEVADGSLGDISKAVPVTFKLVPVGAGSTIQCNATTGTVASGALNVACNFASVPVNVYDVNISIGGNYYTGSADSIVVVYDPSLGFVTGGGVVTHNGVRANFGLNIKYLKNGNAQGNLIYIEHRATGDVVVKSTAMGVMAIVGGEAQPVGKAVVNGVGNYSFIARAIDKGEPGTADQFGLRVTAPNGAVVADLTFNPITLSGGNIQVPKVK
ncbi:MAG TPA: M4 family metallopeptidase [Pyrinomonadaceae bacterium]|jgi:Zn-dependent metalloprotease